MVFGSNSNGRSPEEAVGFVALVLAIILCLSCGVSRARYQCNSCCSAFFQVPPWQQASPHCTGLEGGGHVHVQTCAPVRQTRNHL